MKYIATSSLAKASAKQRAAALHSDGLRTRTSSASGGVGLAMQRTSPVLESMGFEKDVEVEEVDSIVIAVFIFSILWNCWINTDVLSLIAPVNDCSHKICGLVKYKQDIRVTCLPWLSTTDPRIFG